MSGPLNWDWLFGGGLATDTPDPLEELLQAQERQRQSFAAQGNAYQMPGGQYLASIRPELEQPQPSLFANVFGAEPVDVFSAFAGSYKTHDERVFGEIGSVLGGTKLLFGDAMRALEEAFLPDLAAQRAEADAAKQAEEELLAEQDAAATLAAVQPESLEKVFAFKQEQERAAKEAEAGSRIGGVAWNVLLAIADPLATARTAPTYETQRRLDEGMSPALAYPAGIAHGFLRAGASFGEAVDRAVLAAYDPQLARDASLGAGPYAPHQLGERLAREIPVELPPTDVLRPEGQVPATPSPEEQRESAALMFQRGGEFVDIAAGLGGAQTVGRAARSALDELAGSARQWWRRGHPSVERVAREPGPGLRSAEVTIDIGERPPVIDLEEATRGLGPARPMPDPPAVELGGPPAVRVPPRPTVLGPAPEMRALDGATERAGNDLVSRFQAGDSLQVRNPKSKELESFEIERATEPRVNPKTGETYIEVGLKDGSRVTIRKVYGERPRYEIAGITKRDLQDPTGAAGAYQILDELAKVDGAEVWSQPHPEFAAMFPERFKPAYDPKTGRILEPRPLAGDPLTHGTPRSGLENHRRQVAQGRQTFDPEIGRFRTLRPGEVPRTDVEAISEARYAQAIVKSGKASHDMSKAEFHAVFGLEAPLAGIEDEALRAMGADAQSHVRRAVGRKVLAETGLRDPQAIADYYAGKYRLPVRPLVTFEPPTGGSMPRSARGNTQWVRDAKTGALTELRVWLSPADQESMAGTLRHELEHAKDVAEGWVGRLNPARMEVGPEASLGDVFEEWTAGHHQRYKNFELGYLRRAAVKGALREGKPIKEHVLQDFPELRPLAENVSRQRVQAVADQVEPEASRVVRYGAAERVAVADTGDVLVDLGFTTDEPAAALSRLDRAGPSWPGTTYARVDDRVYARGPDLAWRETTLPAEFGGRSITIADVDELGRTEPTELTREAWAALAGPIEARDAALQHEGLVRRKVAEGGRVRDDVLLSYPDVAAEVAARNQPWQLSPDDLRPADPKVGDWLEVDGALQQRQVIQPELLPGPSGEGPLIVSRGEDGQVRHLSGEIPQAPAALAWVAPLDSSGQPLTHRGVLATALQQGLDVPPKALESYPELAPKPVVQQVTSRPVIRGQATTAIGYRDPATPYRFEYAVVDLDDLTPSHLDSFARHPAFPAELQPRDRSSIASQQQVTKLLQLPPEELLAPSRHIDRGAPIVGPDLLVESGNGRVMALRQAAQNGLPLWQKYAEALPAAARQIGIGDLGAMRRPVLVRIRTDQMDMTTRKAFVNEANSQLTLGMSAVETAAQDADRFSFGVITELYVPAAGTIEQALASPKNRGIVGHFVGNLPQQEQGRLLTREGAASKEGVERLKRALFTKVYPGEAGERLARAFFEATESDIRSIEHGIFKSLPAMAKMKGLIATGARAAELDLTPDIARAAELVAAARRAGSSLHVELSQRGLFGSAELAGGSEPTRPQRLLASLFEKQKRSSNYIGAVLTDYAGRVDRQVDPNQMSLIAVKPPEKVDLLLQSLDPSGEALYRQLEGDVRAHGTDEVAERVISKWSRGESYSIDWDPGARQYSQAASKADASELIRRLEEADGKQIDKPTLSDFFVRHLGFPRATSDDAAEKTLRLAGRSNSGFDVGAAVREEGGSAREAKEQIDFINRMEGRDPTASVFQQAADDLNGGRPSSPPEGPGVPPPGQSEAKGLLAENMAHAASIMEPRFSRYILPPTSAFYPMSLDVARTPEGLDLLREVRLIEDETRLMAETFKRGSNPAGGRLGFGDDLPGLDEVRKLIPKEMRGNAFRAVLEGNRAPEGMRLADQIPDPAARQVILDNPQLKEAIAKYNQITDEEARLSGRPDYAGAGDYFRHYTDRPAITKALKDAEKGLVTEFRAASAADRPAVQKQLDAVRGQLLELQASSGRYLKTSELRVPMEAFYGPHKRRSKNLAYYITDIDRHFDMYAYQAARKIILDRRLPRVKELFDKIKVGAVLQKNAPEMSDRFRQAWQSVAQRSLEPFKRTSDYGPTTLVTAQYRDLVDEYLKNALGYTDVGAATDAWLSHSVLDMAGLNAEVADAARAMLKALGYKVLLDLNPMFLLNRLQGPYSGGAYIGPKFYGIGELQTKRDFLARATGHARVPAVRAILEELGLGMLDTRPFIEGYGGSAIGRRLGTMQFAGRSELGNHVAVGAARYYQFQALVQKLKTLKRSLGAGASVDGVVEHAMHDRSLGASFFVQDRYRPRREQLRIAASAAADGTMHEMGLREAYDAIKTTIFHYGRSERTWLVVKGGATVDLATQFMSFQGKQGNFIWSRLTPRGKLRLLTYSAAIGGPETWPYVAALLSAFPAMNAYKNDVEDGQYGFLFKFNLAHAAGVQVPSMAMPMGKFVPGLGPQFGSAQSPEGQLVERLAQTAGPVPGMVAQTGVPAYEAATRVGAGAGARELVRAGANQVPLLRNAQRATEPGLGLYEQARAAAGFRPREEEKMWGRTAQANRESEEDRIKRYYVIRDLAAQDADMAQMLDVLGVTPRELALSIAERGQQPDVRAFREMKIDLKNMDVAYLMWQRALDEAEKGSKKARIFLELTTPMLLEKLLKGMDRTENPVFAERYLEVEQLAEKAGVLRYGPRTPVVRGEQLFAHNWLVSTLQAAPAGLPDDELYEHVRREMDGLNEPNDRRLVQGLLDGYRKTIGLERYRNRLLEPVGP